MSIGRSVTTKATIILTLKVVGLTILLFLCYAAAFSLSGLSTPGPDAASTTGSAPTPAEAAASARPLLLAAFLQSIVFALIIFRSQWSGWKLAGAVFLAFYGLGTVIAQIESVVFLPRQLPPGMIPKLFIAGAITAGLFSPLAVLMLGKMRGTAEPRVLQPRWVMPRSEWAWKLAAMAAAYVILYFTFGYFVAWKDPAVRAYYGGTDLGFLGQMAATPPWLFILQAFRGLLWAAFAWPVIRMLKGQRWEVAFTVALLFTVWSVMLLMPNPYMPEAVRMAHLVETGVSNFIFGWLVGWWLSRHGLMEGNRWGYPTLRRR